MGEPLITITKSEYEELISIKEKFVSAFNENKIILKHDSFLAMGYNRHSYSIVNESEIIKELNEELLKVKEERNDYAKSNEKLQSIYKRWWEYIPRRKWYQLIPAKIKIY